MHSIVTELIEAAKSREMNAAERALVNLGALPVPWAWEGCFGVLANGEVVYVDEEGKPTQLDQLPDGKSQGIATLVYAAKRDARLSCLLPQKPMAAAACPTCQGTGLLTKAKALCGDCIGLGWQHAT